MEMDNSRRPFNRSREPGPKKPRLAADEPNSRPFSHRLMGSGPNQVQSRYDRDKDDTDLSHGGGYQPQPLPQHQQHLDLVEQYRTALSELTCNSKPIITNLTIIAEENLHAAKAIASTICANILEVPSDQKLPSLYLLDSIVKNIGRDYIKYFASRLPEVFCTAYRQVDPPINASMRHLFGTWKGVFHPQVLQIIEKELGFGSSANSSSAPATSRSESQSQRPAHSIHVNPKYLERQRLQQSARPKVIANDIDSALVSSSEDIERLDRPTGVTTGRTWAGPPAKMQRSQRDPRFNPLLDKDSTGVVYGETGCGSEISRNSGLGPGRSVVKVTEQKPWYGVSSGGVGVADAVSTRRNGYPAKHKLQSYPPPKSSNIDSQFRSGNGMSSSWKNSEEEEFSWDSMDSRSTDHDATINMSSITKKDHWTTDGSEKLDFENNLQKTLLREGGNRIGTSSLSGVSYDYSATVSGPTTSGSSLSRTGMGPQIRSSSYIGNPCIGISGASSGTIGQQQVQSPGLISPSALSPMRHHSPVDITRHTQTDLKTSQFSGKLSLGLINQYNDGSENSLPLSLETSGQLNASTSSLLAAIAKSGSIPVNTVFSSLSGLGSQDKGFEASQASSMALPGGPLSTQLPIPRLNLESSTVLATSTAATDASQGKTTKTEPEESLNVTKNSDPISSLLSSLVAKGLISTSKKEPLAPVPSQTAKPLLNVKQEAITATAEPVSSASVSTKISVSVAVNGVSTPEPIAESSELPRPSPVTEDIKNLIGFEFKPEVLRKFHSSVIDDLFDGFPYQCGICGLRLNLKERLDRHLDWHASQNPEQRDAGNASNKWYLHSNHWVARRNGLPLYGAESIKVEEEKCSEMSEIIEPMVPADESQCACILCGNLFEDFYDLGREEWMFRGAVYMTIPCETPRVGAESDSNFCGLIVHANCLSENSIQDLGLVNGV